MANMTIWSEKATRRAWTNEPQLKLPFAITAATTTYYDGQAVGRDASGNVVNMDDTVKAEFIGFLTDAIQEIVNPTDTAGDGTGYFHRPYAYVALIAAAVAGQEGKKVFWQFNNQVSYSPGSNSNFAGTVLLVVDPTHVLVLPPWLRGATQNGSGGIYTAAAGAPTTLTKFDINKAIALPLTSAQPITLPAASSVSPDDTFLFFNLSSNSSVPTITAAGADTINGAATLAMSSVQYATLTLRSDGVSKWYAAAQNVSGTLGATSFTGNVTVSGTEIITSASAGAFQVGANGATNPVLTTDASAGSVATGVNIVGKAAGSGAVIQAISSTGGEALSLLGGASTTSTAGGAVTITGAAGGATSGAGGAVTNTGGVGTAGNSAGGAVSNVGGAGQGSAAGGTSGLTGGAGGVTGAGGACVVTGGAGGATSGTGGAVTIAGGAGTNGNAVGGAASVTAGAGQGTGAGAVVSIVGGASGAGATGNGGVAKIVGGAAASTNGTGGAAQVTGGVATGTGTGGACTITGGASAGASGTAGAVNIDAGAATGGTGGVVNIGATNAVANYIGRGALKSPILGLTTSALGTTQNSTPTAAQLLGGVVTQTGVTGAGTFTLPSGTTLSAALALAQATGDSFDCIFANLGGGQTITITGATGTTVLGTAAVPTGKFARMTFTNTGANTWNIYCLVSA